VLAIRRAKPQAAKWAGIIEFAVFVSAFCAFEMRTFDKRIAKIGCLFDRAALEWRREPAADFSRSFGSSLCESKESRLF
jgi:hypothetical protein